MFENISCKFCYVLICFIQLNRTSRMKPTSACSSRAARPRLNMFHERPTDRVRRCLLAEFDRPDLAAGTRLPPVRRFAARLNVGVATVHAVLRELAREGRIRAKVGNGTFLTVPPSSPDSKALKIALGGTLLDTLGGPWSYRIAQGILNAASQSSQRMMILPLSQQPVDPAAMARELLKERSMVDGLILFSFSSSEEVRAAYEKAGKPAVQVNPPTMIATTNFVSSDYYGTSLHLGRAWKKTGRKRVILLVEESMVVSTRLRCFGLMAGLEFDGQGDISVQIVKASSVSEKDGYRAIRRMLDHANPAPDAIYCSGDLLALGAIEALRERRLRIPQDVSVTGGTGMDLSGTVCPQLTRMRQPFEQVGQRLVAMLCRRIEQRGAAAPGEILAARFVGGATTRPVENELLDAPDLARPEPKFTNQMEI